MNYSKILGELGGASLFELFRLEQAIRHVMEDPARIEKIKGALKVGQDIEYFDTAENRLVEAIIIELRRTRALVRNRHDGQLWNIPFHQINLGHADIAISGSTGKLDRNSLRVGDKVAFKDRKGNELFGDVVKLNKKTAAVLVGPTRWTVGYGLLSVVIEGALGNEMNLIEGEFLSGK